MNLPDFKYLVFLLILIIHTQVFAVANGHKLSAWQKPEIIRLMIFEPSQNTSDSSMSLARLNQASFGTCTGVAISDSLVLTAGHCLMSEENEKLQINALIFENERDWKMLKPISTRSPYVFEKIETQEDPNAVVPGCSAKRKVLVPQFQTDDWALLEFSPGTFKHWARVSEKIDIKIGNTVEIYGYGSHSDSMSGGLGSMSLPQHDDLRYFASSIKRENSQRWAILATPNKAFADEGDSGSPVFYNNELIGLISTVQPKCETEHGEDFEIMNSIIKINKTWF